VAPGAAPAGTRPAPVEPKSVLAPLKADGTDREADRRQVTVLFADLSGFTALSERLDPEDVRAFQNALFEMLARTITRYDGFVEKFVGDAVLAVFGAPVAHEDDPARACDAALKMLEGGAALSDEWAGRLGQPVTLHAGIHTGPVVAGHLGRAAGAVYAVTGDTVNTAARLLAAAAPGVIVVSEATHALVRHRFACELGRRAVALELWRPRGVMARRSWRDVEDLFGRFFDDWIPSRGDSATGITPAVDMVDRGNEVVLHADLPASSRRTSG